MAGNEDCRLERFNLIQRLHPVFFGFVFGNSEVDMIEDGIARHHGFEGWNIDEAVARAVALHAAGDGELLAFQGKYRGGKLLGEDRIGARDVVAIGWKPELLPGG